jgi:hypothetical protein
MRAGDGVDAVDLHKADPLDQVVQCLSARRACRSFRKRVTVQKKTAGGGVWYQCGHPNGLSLQKVSANAGFAPTSAACVLDKDGRIAYYPVVS